MKMRSLIIKIVNKKREPKKKAKGCVEQEEEGPPSTLLRAVAAGVQRIRQLWGNSPPLHLGWCTPPFFVSTMKWVLIFDGQDGDEQQAGLWSLPPVRAPLLDCHVEEPKSAILTTLAAA
jgi:hypothetical protein